MENKQDLDESTEVGHVNGKSILDSSVIRQLELEILKSMFTPESDPIFRPFPESSQGSITTQSFSMESLNVESITTTSDETSSYSARSNCCCSKKSSAPVLMDVGENKSSFLLPPQSKEDAGKITLVLDLDETLVHSSFLAIPQADHKFILTIGSRPVGLFMCVRPGVEKLFKELGNLYEIVIFTASNKVYADAVIDYIDQGKVVKHRLYRESCTDFKGNFVKDLARINRDLSKVIIVDNSNFAFLLQPYNAIPVSTWIDDVTDNQIFIVKDFLKLHYKCKNVYTILVNPEKNGIKPIDLPTTSSIQTFTSTDTNLSEEK